MACGLQGQVAAAYAALTERINSVQPQHAHVAGEQLSSGGPMGGEPAHGLVGSAPQHAPAWLGHLLRLVDDNGLSRDGLDDLAATGPSQVCPPLRLSQIHWQLR